VLVLLEAGVEAGVDAEVLELRENAGAVEMFARNKGGV